MTVLELFTLTIGMLGLTTENATTYKTTLYPQLNMVLADCFKLENNLREDRGIALLTTIPTITADADILTYQDDLQKQVLPYGLARLLVLSDDDTVRAGFFGSQYVEAQALLSVGISDDVTDYYSQEEE